MVGELVGARLIAHAGSLINLAKHPASTIQILGAEKALFRALKTKHDTPKYGLIYHASLIGQAAPKNKGKISRVLAAKTALAIRVDAMGNNDGPTIAIESRMKVEARIRQLEGGQKLAITNGASKSTPAKYDASHAKALAPPKFNDSSDIVLSSKKDKKEKKKKRDREEEQEDDDAGDDDDDEQHKKKKSKKEKKEKKSKKDKRDDDDE
jgi:nucleolar protein 58